MFTEESARKQEELTERVRREVSVACEKQLATQHKLTAGPRATVEQITEGL